MLLLRRVSLAHDLVITSEPNPAAHDCFGCYKETCDNDYLDNTGHLQVLWNSCLFHPLVLLLPYAHLGWKLFEDFQNHLYIDSW